MAVGSKEGKTVKREGRAENQEEDRESVVVDTNVCVHVCMCVCVRSVAETVIFVSRLGRKEGEEEGRHGQFSMRLLNPF